MIRALAFDLDGTLVQTERLKALSYARAVRELCPQRVDEALVIEAFKDVVGLARREVALGLMARFDLEAAASKRMEAFGFATPWQAFVDLRLGYYDQLLSDPAVLLDNQWPFNVALLKAARSRGCSTALATMSYAPQARRVLDVLGLDGEFDVVATREDVERGKPDPEIYLLVLRELGVRPQDCLVIEDSAVGVVAAQAAGCHVIAVSTPFTHDRLHALTTLDAEHLIDDPSTLMVAVERVFDGSWRPA